MKTPEQIKSISKFLSLVLRHQPDTIGIELDPNGWTSVAELLKKVPSKYRLDKKTLDFVVENNDKKRFAFNEDQSKIRANQGHSVSIDLALTPVEPPQWLYHGTVQKFIESIKKEGLQKMSRQHVHLSQDLETAKRVGARRGIPIILSIHSGRMAREGHLFYLSENNVWLTDTVPKEYIEFKN